MDSIREFNAAQNPVHPRASVRREARSKSHHEMIDTDVLHQHIDSLKNSKKDFTSPQLDTEQ